MAAELIDMSEKTEREQLARQVADIAKHLSKIEKSQERLSGKIEGIDRQVATIEGRFASQTRSAHPAVTGLVSLASAGLLVFLGWLA